MEKPIFIYGLRCPVANQIRYIGKSNQPERRLFLHIHAAKMGKPQHVSRWIRDLLNTGLSPSIEILAAVPLGDDWQSHERTCIANAIRLGWPLTNGTLGGEGVVFSSIEAFEKAKRARHAGFTAEVRLRQSIKMKAVWADKEKRAKRSQAIKEVCATPDGRTRLSRAAHSRTPEGESRRLVAIQKYWEDPKHRAEASARTKRRMTREYAQWMSSKQKKGPRS